MKTEIPKNDLATKFEWRFSKEKIILMTEKKAATIGIALFTNFIKIRSIIRFNSFVFS